MDKLEWKEYRKNDVFYIDLRINKVKIRANGSTFAYARKSSLEMLAAIMNVPLCPSLNTISDFCDEMDFFNEVKRMTTSIRGA